jgi:hypothetical protein
MGIYGVTAFAQRTRDRHSHGARRSREPTTSAPRRLSFDARWDADRTPAHADLLRTIITVYGRARQHSRPKSIGVILFVDDLCDLTSTTFVNFDAFESRPYGAASITSLASCSR